MKVPQTIRPLNGYDDWEDSILTETGIVWTKAAASKVPLANIFPSDTKYPRFFKMVAVNMPDIPRTKTIRVEVIAWDNEMFAEFGKEDGENDGDEGIPMMMKQ